MKMEITITDFRAEVKPVVRSDQIKAFANWIFETSIGNIKIAGGTIREKPFGKFGKLLLTYEVPAVRARGGFIKTLYIDNKEIYKQLCNETVEEYYRETGEPGNNVYFEEEINLDDIHI